MKRQKIIIGTRGSQLALWQAEYIKSLLNSRFPALDVELKIIKTQGDKILDSPLSKIGGKGLFTKELELELLDGSIDFAVHSLKDLPTEIPEGLLLGAVTERHFPEDVLIAHEKGLTIKDLPEGGTVATGSLRRRAQLKIARPDLHIEELRGNVPTRIKKFEESGWDAIILARAGVERLGLERHIASIIPKEIILPAVGQGALGIEISSNNKFAVEICTQLNHEKTELETRAERQFLRSLGGGCQNPIAAFAYIAGSELHLEGFASAIDGARFVKDSIAGYIKSPEKTGETLAEKILNKGASIFLEL